VIAHLVAVADDIMAGRLAGPPDDAQTAEQVAGRRHLSMTELLDEWAALAPRAREFVSTNQMWPAFVDVLSHEHDVRGAIGRPAHRDAPELVLGAELLVSVLRPPAALTVRVGARELRVGPHAGAPVELHTNPFEAFRFRMGRRSRGQLTAMAWVGDPAPVLDSLSVF
jgi:hypothetical protein